MAVEGGRWRWRRVEGRWLWRRGGGSGGTEVSVEEVEVAVERGVAGG